MNKKRTFNGIVVRATKEKTCSVEVTRTKVHPIYQKRMKLTKRYLVHDELGLGNKVGKAVMIAECRPLSKTKKWKLVN